MENLKVKILNYIEYFINLIISNNILNIVINIKPI